MPIRVEHGPNLAAVGQLAYRTGQYEYRNKRRTELERIAMQQAEMRQKAQQQQQQIAATLQGQKMSYMGAMQRLQQQQQFGQINAEQANQWQVQADVKAQENKMIWGKQLGQNQLDLANMNAGIADQKEIKNLQWKQEWDGLKRRLNGPGQAAYLKVKQQEAAALADVRGNPAEAGNIREQFRPKYEAVEADVNNTIDAELQVGSQSVHIAHSLTADQVAEKDPEIRKRNEAMVGQPKVYKTVKVRNPDGSVVYEYTPATTQMVVGPDGNMIEVPNSPQQIHDNTTTVVKRSGRDFLGKLNSTNGIYEIDDNAKPIETAEWKAEEAAKDDAKERAKAAEDREAKAIEWEISENKQRRDYNSRQQLPAHHIDLDVWMQDAGANPYRDAPEPPAPVPPEPPAPVPPVPPVEPLALNAPEGAAGTEPVVLSEEEAMQMVQAGHIPIGTIVQLPSGQRIPAGQQANPNDIPLMMRVA